jgi:hypothetical protein
MEVDRNCFSCPIFHISSQLFRFRCCASHQGIIFNECVLVIFLQRFKLCDPNVSLVKLHLQIIISCSQIFLHFPKNLDILRIGNMNPFACLQYLLSDKVKCFVLYVKNNKVLLGYTLSYSFLKRLSISLPLMSSSFLKRASSFSVLTADNCIVLSYIR